MKTQTILALAASALLFHAAQASANVRITEWMYSGGGGEFIEFTNLGGSAVDFTGWSYDDDSRTPGVFSLTGFGVVAAGETVVITEDNASAFRTDWNLAASVKVLGGYTNNIGRADEINLFDNSGALVDRLTYGDNAFPGTIRTQNASGRPGSVAALGANNVSLWVLSTVGDVEGSYRSLKNDIGSPGITAAIPEPETYALFLAGLGLLGVAAKRRH
jgi:predicted extracellular nuclease